MRNLLITGSTDGIGLELARLYSDLGERLILSGRRPRSDLDPTLFTSQRYCRTDLLAHSAPDDLARFLEERGIDRLDLLINNAATGFYGDPKQQAPEDIHRILTVNLTTPASLTRRLLPWLRKGGGKIVFVSSVISALPCPDFAVYAASKAALDGLARSLRIELKGSVRVQVVHPGATRTGLHEKIGVSRESMDWTSFPPAEVTARRLLDAVENDRPQVTIGLANNLVRIAGRRFSRPLDALMSRRRRARSKRGEVK